MYQDFNLFARCNTRASSTSVDKYSRFVNSYINPTILEERQLNVAQMDVFSRLLFDRIIFLGTDIDDDVANVIQAQLLYLSSNDNDDISIYINSPGGSVTAGLGIYDTMQIIRPEIKTICTGLAASMSAILLSSGTKGKRNALKHSNIMLHEPMGGISPRTKCSDFLIEAEEMKKCKDTLFELLAENCGKTKKEMEDMCSHDKWMTAQDAIDYGVIDSILKKEDEKNEDVSKIKKTKKK